MYIDSNCRCALKVMSVVGTVMFVFGLIMIIFGCDKNIVCPLYSYINTTIKGVRIEEDSCYVKQTSMYSPCFTLYITYSIGCEYNELFSYNRSNNSYGYVINQARMVLVNDLDNTCGMSGVSRFFSISGVIFMTGSGVILFYIIVALIEEYSCKCESDIQPTIVVKPSLSSQTRVVVIVGNDPK